MGGQGLRQGGELRHQCRDSHLPGEHATPQSAATNEDEAKAITLTGTDADPADTLTFTVVTGPAHGTLSGTAPNLTYTPAADYYGPDGFTFKANDGLSDSPPATVTIAVNAVNDPPVLGTFNAAPRVLKTRAVTVTVPAADIDSTALTFSLSGAPAWAAIDPTTGVLTLSPGLDIPAGAYGFMVVVTDNGSGTDPYRDPTPLSVTQTVTATVYAAGVDGPDLYVYGSPGDDALGVSSTSVTTATVGGAAVNVVLGLTADSGEAAGYTVPAGGKIVVVAGDGDDTITVAGAVPADVRAGGGTDLVSVTGTDGPDSMTLSGLLLTVNSAAVALSGVESLTVAGGAGGDTLAASGTTLPGDLALIGGAGTDAVSVG